MEIEKARSPDGTRIAAHRSGGSRNNSNRCGLVYSLARRTALAEPKRRQGDPALCALASWRDKGRGCSRGRH